MYCDAKETAKAVEKTSEKDHLVMIELGAESKKEPKRRKSAVGKRKSSAFLKRVK